jgi:DNA excision repair protein ERCC-4
VKPDGFALVCDTREQTPWDFPEDVRIVRAALPAGDYAPVGGEQRCAIERKSLADYLASITGERERFKRELERLKGYDFACVLVEAHLEEVTARRYRANVHPAAVLGTTAALTLDYCPVLFVGDRRHAADMALRLLRRFWEKHLRTSPEAAA